MASTIKIKNSSTAGAIPTSSDLVQGELAVNVTDKTIFTENASGTVVELGKNYTGFKNRIINGAMMIDQRNAGASVTPIDAAYTLDRYQARLTQSSKYSVAKSSVAPAGFINSLLVTSLSAFSVGSTDFFQVRQHIEGFNVADLGWGTASAQPVTVSFWVRSSLTGTFGGVLSNADGDRSYQFSYSIAAANTWEQKTVTIAGDTTGTWPTGNVSSFVLAFALGAGSSVSGSTGSWGSTLYRSVTGATSVVGTNGATFYITGVQLEKGSTATSFDYRPYGTELALCQRYFLPLFTPTANAYQNVCSIYSTTAAYFSITYPVEMRTTPTITNNSMVVNVAAALNSTIASFGTAFPSTRACGVQLTRTSGATFTAGNAGHVDIVGGSAGGSLFASAEL